MAALSASTLWKGVGWLEGLEALWAWVSVVEVAGLGLEDEKRRARDVLESAKAHSEQLRCCQKWPPSASMEGVWWVARSWWSWE